MCKRPVGFRHPVGIIFFLYTLTGSRCGVDKLECQFFAHRTSLSRTCILNRPTHRMFHLLVSLDIDRNLVRRSTNSPALDLYMGPCVFERFLEDLESIFTGFFLNDFHSAVENTLCDRFLPTPHQLIDKTCGVLVVVNRIGNDNPFCWFFSSHGLSLIFDPLFSLTDLEKIFYKKKPVVKFKTGPRRQAQFALMANRGWHAAPAFAGICPCDPLSLIIVEVYSLDIYSPNS